MIKRVIIYTWYILFSSTTLAQNIAGIKFPTEIYPKSNFDSYKTISSYHGDIQNQYNFYGSGNTILIFSPDYFSTAQNESKNYTSQIKINKIDSLYEELLIKSKDSLAMHNLSNNYLDLFRENSLRNFPLALNYIGKSIKLLQGNFKNEIEIAIRYSMLSNFYSHYGFRDSAIYYLNQCENVLPKIEKFSGNKKHSLFYNLSRTMHNMGEYDKAIKYDSLSLIYSKESLSVSDFAIIDALFQMGWLYDRKNDFKKSIDYYHQALDIISLHPLSDTLRYKVSILHNLGWEYSKTNNYHTAIKYYTQALNLSYYLKDTVGITNTFVNLGYTYISLSNYDSSLLYFQKVNTIQKYENPETVYWEGRCHFDLKNNDKATEFFLKAITLSEKNNEVNKYNWIISDSYYYLSEISRKKKEYTESLSHLSLSKFYTKDTTLLATNYMNIGNIHYTLGNCSLALKYYDSCIHVAEPLNKNNINIFYAHLNKANAFSCNNENYKFEQEISKCNDLISSSDVNKQEMLNAYYKTIADNFLKNSNLDSSLLYYEKNLIYFNEINLLDSSLRFEVNAKVGSIYAALNKTKLALNYYLNAVNFIHSGLDSSQKSNLYLTISWSYIGIYDFVNGNNFLNKCLKSQPINHNFHQRDFFARYLEIIFLLKNYDSTNYMTKSLSFINDYFPNYVNSDTNYMIHFEYSYIYNNYFFNLNQSKEIIYNIEYTINGIEKNLFRKIPSIELTKKIIYYCLNTLNILHKFNKPAIEKKLYNQIIINLEKINNTTLDTLALKNVYYQIVNYHKANNNIDSVLFYYNSILKYLDHKNDLPEVCEIMQIQSNILYYTKDEKRNAIKKLNSAIFLLENSKIINLNLQSNLYREMAYFKIKLNEYKDASIFFVKAINSNPVINLYDNFEKAYCELELMGISKFLEELAKAETILKNELGMDPKKYSCEIRNYLNCYYKKVFYCLLKNKELSYASSVMVGLNYNYYDPSNEILNVEWLCLVDTKRAIELLEKVIQKNIYPISQIKQNPYLKSIKKLPEFKALIEKYTPTNN